MRRLVLFILFLLLFCELVLIPIHNNNINKPPEPEPPIIVCSFCKGTGKRETDINKLMMEASLALFINHHLMVDKCERCVKISDSEDYEYCSVVNDRHQTLITEYAAAGPKIQMSACNKCIGMGTFSSKDLTTGKWITQQEWEKNETRNSKNLD